MDIYQRDTPSFPNSDFTIDKIKCASNDKKGYPTGTNFTFSADRPPSRGGSTPFTLTTNNDNGKYQTGGISLITSLRAGQLTVATIPTMSQWSLFLFGIIVFTLCVLVAYNLRGAGVKDLSRKSFDPE